MADHTKAIELESDNPEWYGYRGDCYVEMEDYTSALKDYDKAIDLAPNDPSQYNNRAEFYRYYLKEYELALK